MIYICKFKHFLECCQHKLHVVFKIWRTSRRGCKISKSPSSVILFSHYKLTLKCHNCGAFCEKITFFYSSCLFIFIEIYIVKIEVDIVFRKIMETRFMKLSEFLLYCWDVSHILTLFLSVKPQHLRSARWACVVRIGV